LVGFLRGLLTNLGTPHGTSVIRSILIRPRFAKDIMVSNLALIKWQKKFRQTIFDTIGDYAIVSFCT